jgi:DNA-binding NarL/FixJ family response regulator
VRVVLVDDLALFRKGLAALLEAIGVEVVGQAGTAEEGLTQVALTTPDVVVMDIEMPPTFTDEGLVAARQLKERYPGIGVLVLSGHVRPAPAARLLDGQLNGVGYLLKQRVDDAEPLRDALDRIRRGELVLDSDVVQALLRRRQNAQPLAELSSREREVLALMAEGRSNAGIAQNMNLAVKTVEKSVASIFIRLELQTDTDDNRRVLAVLAWLRASRP